MNKIPMYRTIKGIVQLIKKDDPDTAITESYIRRLIKEEVLVYESNGSRYMLEYYQTMETIYKLFNKNNNTKLPKSINSITSYNMHSADKLERAKARIKVC